jgi:hypothetical protein
MGGKEKPYVSFSAPFQVCLHQVASHLSVLFQKRLNHLDMLEVDLLNPLAGVSDRDA